MKRLIVKSCVWIFAVWAVCACDSDDNENSEEESKTGDTPVDSDTSTEAAEPVESDTSTDTATAETEDFSKVTVSIPEGGMMFSASTIDLESMGYSQNEFFFEGQAVGYKVAGGAATDGKWILEENAHKPFKSRVLVRIPKDASKFNGIVIVEWLNVSGGVDADPGFMYNIDLITREGYGWVGVSAQATGIQGGGMDMGALMGGGDGGPEITPLKEYSPERYGSLTHPGSNFAYDVFTKAASIIREPREVDVLGGLKAEYLIAYGESQSAGRMVSYVNGVHPLTKAYDAYFIHSRGSGGSGFGGGGGFSIPGFGGGSGEPIRDDLDVKVFQFQTETDVVGMLGFLPARQPDTDKVVTWEVAGTAHADKYMVDFNAENPMGQVPCDDANDGPQFRVIRAALHALSAWMRDGTEPPHGEVLATDSSGKSLRDEYGNAKGGIRSPDVDVPIATLSGDTGEGGFDMSGITDLLSGGNMISMFCFIFGSTTPFTPEQLIELYPTHEDYVQKVKDSANAAVQAGFLLEPEAQGFIEEAENAPVPN